MCNFSIPFSGSVGEVLGNAKSAVQGQGGAFVGDQSSGAFQVSVFGSPIRGTYQIEGQVLHILIESKPFLVPCSTIEGFLKSHIR